MCVREFWQRDKVINIACLLCVFFSFRWANFELLFDAEQRNLQYLQFIVAHGLNGQWIQKCYRSTIWPLMVDWFKKKNILHVAWKD